VTPCNKKNKVEPAASGGKPSAKGGKAPNLVSTDTKRGYNLGWDDEMQAHD
jgi:hypothetical protein